MGGSLTDVDAVSVAGNLEELEVEAVISSICGASILCTTDTLKHSRLCLITIGIIAMFKKLCVKAN